MADAVLCCVLSAGLHPLLPFFSDQHPTQKQKGARAQLPAFRDKAAMVITDCQILLSGSLSTQ